MRLGQRRYGPTRALAVAPVLALVVGLGPWPQAEPARPRPVVPTQAEVEFVVPSTARAASQPAEVMEGATAADVAAVSPAVPVDGVRVVGATWAAGSGSDVAVEYRVQDGGGWSAWAPLPVEEDHGPDAGSAEASQLRPGTEPLVVGAAGAVQMRLRTPSGAMPQDAVVDVVDPGRSPADARVGKGPTGAAVALPSAPAILSRADWGADESLKTCCTEYGRVRAGFVHHTVSTNTYSAADVPAIIRGIYAFHVSSRGYRDIGYNYLVDRFGRVWEGRYGGVDRAVVGAHTSGYNYESFAMSAIGNFDVVSPPEAVVDSFARLYAWKLGIHGVPPVGTTTLNGTTFASISGHRDVNSTACPGRYLYARLPDIRSRAAAQQGAWAASAPRRELDSRAGPDLVLNAGRGSVEVASGSGEEIIGTIAALSGPGWSAYSRVLTTRDFDGDRRNDVLGYEPATDRLWLHPGDGAGGLIDPRRSLGVGWKTFTQITAAGDLNGDGWADLVARDAQGGLWLYRGDGAGGFLGARQQIGVGWNAIDLLVGNVDWDGDGRTDLLGREAGTGVLLLYRGNGAGAIVERRSVGIGWQVMDGLAAPGDWDGDGRSDVLARERSTGALWLYPGDGRGGWYPQRRSLGAGWNTVDQISTAGDVTGDGVADVVARRGDSMVAYPGDGPALLRTPSATAALVGPTSRVLSPGDFSGDGRSDVLSVNPGTGDLTRHVGDGTGRLSAGSVINAGWSILRSVNPAGDFDNDGRADLLGIGVADNRLYLYRGDGAGGFLDRRDLGGDWSTIDIVFAVGRWDGDGAADLVSRDRASGDLRLHPGNGPGNLLPGTVINRGWGGFDLLQYVGDLDRSGWPDLVARLPGSSTLLLYPGGPSGQIYPARTLTVPGVVASQLRSVG